MSFQPGEQFRAAVEEGDLFLIRSEIIELANADPRDEAGGMAAALAYARSKGVAVLQPHDPVFPMESNPAAWTQDYWHTVKAHLMSNFSEERLAHLIEVGRGIFPPRQPAPDQPAPTRPTERAHHTSAKEGPPPRPHPGRGTQPGNPVLNLVLLAVGGGIALGYFLVRTLLKRRR